ncbi:MAG: DUF1959 family protein [Methanobacterium sp.]
MSDETIKIIKGWKFESYAYKEQVFKPLSELLDVSIEEVEELLEKNLDMARIESSLSSAEQARLFRLEKQIDLDLGLDYLYHLELLDVHQVDSIREEIINELESSGILNYEINSEEYKDLIKEAKEKILGILRD